MAELMPVPSTEDITFVTTDQGHQYLDRLNVLGVVCKTAIEAYNAQIQAGNDAAEALQAAIAANTVQQANNDKAITEQQAISETGLPLQTGQANKVFTTNGKSGAWRHASGFTRRVTTDFDIQPGEKVEVYTATTDEIICTPPLTLAQYAPFYLANNQGSKGDVIWVVPEGVTYDTLNKYGKSLAVGDKIRIKPGQRLALQCRVPDVLEG